MPDVDLQAIALVIIGPYIVGILGIGFWVGRKEEDSEGFFLAGAGYDQGIAVWNDEWMATLVLLVFAGALVLQLLFPDVPLMVHIIVVLLGGIFWKRPGREAAFWTLATVFPLGLVGFFAGEIFERFDLQL